MKYTVKGDHPIYKRPDKVFYNICEARVYADDLKSYGYVNVAIYVEMDVEESLSIANIMLSMGCKEIRPLIYRHPDINLDLDFTATADNKVLLRLSQIFSEKGYESCKQEFREFLEI